MIEDLFKKDGGNTNPLSSSKNVKKDLVYGLLKTLYDEYPNYVPLKKLAKYQNILSDFSGITIPSVHRNSENSSRPEFLAEAALVQLTQYIEKQDNFESYRITIKGIELLNAVDLNKSSGNLYELSRWLFTFTAILAILAMSNALASIYVSTKNINTTLQIFVVFLALSIVIFIIALVLYKRIIGGNK